MAELVALLTQLTEVGNGTLTGQGAADALTEAIEAIREIRCGSGWAALEGEEVSPVALTRAMGDILKSQEPGLQRRAATLYGALLSLKDAPVGTFCEPYSFSAFLHCLRAFCLPNNREMAADGDAGGEHASVANPIALLEDLGELLKNHSLRGMPDMFELLLTELVGFTGSTVASGRPEKGNKCGAAGAACNQAASVAEAAFALLPVAMDARHGSVLQSSAVVCHKLVPALLGLEAAKRGSNCWDRRTAALQLINSFFSAHEVAQPCRLSLMRQLCLRAPDRSECRQVAVSSVQALIPGCTPGEFRTFCLFLYKLSRDVKTGYRTTAIEVASALLSGMPTPFAATGGYQRMLDGSCGAGDELDAPWSAVCLAIVVSRSNDKSASVRGKAISCLADCAQLFAKQLLDASTGGREEISAFLPALCACRHIKVQVTTSRAAAAAAAAGEDEGDDDGEGDRDDQDPAAVNAPPPQPQVTASIPGKPSLELSWMRTMCHTRCRDEKAVVRKAALQLLESVLQLSAAAARGRVAAAGPSTAAAAGPTAQDLQVLEEGTMDSLVSVRKAALQVVCNLVACYPQHAELACVWARCVLPLLRDSETAVQEAVLERLSELLLEPLAVLGGRSGGRRGGGGTPFTVEAEVRPRLAALAQMGRAASGCLGKALTMLKAKKLLKGATVASGLETLLTADRAATPEGQAAGAAAAEGTKEAQLRMQERRTARDQREGAWLVLVEVAGQDPSASSWQFLYCCWGELQAGIMRTEASAQEGAMLLWVISHAASRFPVSDAATLASGLLQAILGLSLPCTAVAAHVAALHKLTQSEGGQAVVGAPARWCAQVQEACEDVLGKAMEARGNLSGTLTTHCQLALFTIGEVALLRETKVSGGLAVKVQSLTYARSGNQNGPAQACASQTAMSAQAWTCLGKLCMVDEALAKKCVPLMVQEMSTSPTPVVRTNLLMGLADMVVQFTGLADAYVGRLAAMVRDPHELVRRQALALLANLLLRDYVKSRGALVHRFLLALVDESPAVRELANYLLRDALATKAPLLAYAHFAESIYILNDCREGLRASRSGGDSAELAADLALHSALEGGGAFHLKGSTPIMRAKRDIIYTALLRRMTPEQRFSAFRKITRDILEGVVDGRLALSESEEVVGDTLRLLSCKDMKVTVGRPGGTAAEEDAEQAQEEDPKGRGKFGSLLKRYIMDNTISAMVELRYMLQGLKHPLLGSLMLCMATLLRDYKAELGEILASDKQLATEIAHDLKHYENLVKQQQQQEAAMAAALAPKPPTGRTSGTTASAAAAALTKSTAPAASATAAGAASAAAAPAATRSQMPPRPVPADRQRHKTILPGVDPSRTPIAAELLATGSRLGRGARRLSAQHTPFEPAGPGGAGPAGTAMTPAAGLHGVGSGSAATMRTPLTGVPGTLQRNIPGGRAVMLSPAPLSTRARLAQQKRAPAGAAITAAPFAAGAGEAPAAGARALDAVLKEDGPQQHEPIVLPNPEAAEQRNQALRTFGPHIINLNAAAAAAAAHPSPGKPPQRTPQAAAAAAAARAAGRKMVDEMLGDENEGAGPARGAGADHMDVDGAPGPNKSGAVGATEDGAAAGKSAGLERCGGSGAKGRAAAAVPQEVRAIAVGPVRVADGAAAPRGCKGRTKRRHG